MSAIFRFIIKSILRQRKNLKPNTYFKVEYQQKHKKQQKTTKKRKNIEEGRRFKFLKEFFIFYLIVSEKSRFLIRDCRRSGRTE